MGRVLTNNTAVIVTDETSLGVAGTTWDQLEPNDISTFGATITTVAREPISKDRSRRKGTVVDLESAVELEHDLTKAVFIRFAEGFVFANFQGDQFGNPTAVTAATDDYTVPSGPTALQNQLVYARGHSNAANNGLKTVNAGSTATSVSVAEALVDETPPANASLEIAGWQFATSDLSITVTAAVPGVSPATAAIVSAAVDLTTIGVHVGQLIHVGGLVAGQQFSAGAGYARVRSISVTTIVADKLGPGLATDPGTGDTVQLLFGLFLKNVATDDAEFLERSYQFELALPGLEVPGPGTMYEYAIGNYANTLAINVPLTDKATITIGFIGTDTELPVPTAGRKAGAASALAPTQTASFNTSADVMRLRVTGIDDVGITSCFQDFTLTLGNNVSGQRCIGTLGPTFINVGNFDVDIEGQIVLTDPAVIAAVRNNETVSLDLLLENDDGAISIDLPSLTLGDGSKEFPVDESVLTNLSGQAFKDAFFGTQIGISTFPVVPV